MKDSQAMNLKVGAFVLASIVIFIIFVFFLGGESSFFNKNYALETSFSNTAGLAEGASVRLSGLKIGSVQRIQFPDVADKNFIAVRMEVTEEGMKRISNDAVATIRTEGLLGDKYIEILRGTKQPPAKMPDLLQISSYTPPEFGQLLGQSEELIDNIISISKSLDEIVKAFGKEENIANISRTIASIRKTTEAIETEPGVLNALIYGNKDKSAKNFGDTLAKLNESVTGLSALLGDIKKGDGMISALIYDKKLADKLDGALTNVNSFTEEISEEEGILREFKETMKNLRRISEKLEGGEGTLGALINDPEMYDNLKGLLGEAERSRFVRSSVRYFIEESKSEESNKKLQP